jgi:hypothetical protein
MGRALPWLLIDQPLQRKVLCETMFLADTARSNLVEVAPGKGTADWFHQETQGTPCASASLALNAPGWQGTRTRFGFLLPCFWLPDCPSTRQTSSTSTQWRLGVDEWNPLRMASLSLSRLIYTVFSSDIESYLSIRYQGRPASDIRHPTSDFPSSRDK